jgi:cell shape-determining protein MreD
VFNNHSLYLYLKKFQKSLPLFLIFIGILIDRFSFSPGFPCAPSLSIAFLYYWAMYRPDLLPVSGVFLLALMDDSLRGICFGFSSLTFLLIYSIALLKRVYFATSFNGIWFIYFLANLVIALLQEAGGWYAGYRFDPNTLITYGLFNALLYPWVCYGTNSLREYEWVRV